ncbi:transcriptional repressor [Acaricomes phytoseiuli]|uniref:Fur family transcriptional regulator n=1 Tax=Acaricomes phytoseiuli TaxID=291968 RepID=UPI0022230B02|nr:Fur family transcriptional regulator [Acaricomes phytoseiuli]MCW1248938.1 transcriptional repressor [Acaricomes phytoseiuli]
MSVIRETSAEETSADAPAWAATLRSHGRRVTKQRLGVLTAAHSAPHQDAERIWSTARAELQELTLQSVYTVLSDLTALGLLRKIDLSAGPARYETRVGDNHHHAICTVCGQIEDIDCAVGHAPCLQPSGSTMSIYQADITFHGTCAACLSASDAAHLDAPEPPLNTSHSEPQRTTTEGES